MPVHRNYWRHPVVVLLLLAAALSAPGAAAQTMSVAARENVAIKGYDAVAYFTDKRAVKGNPAYQHEWNDALWRFASSEHRDAFAADPERYAPQFSGFCAWGMAQGVVVEADPEQWDIVDGKLYLKMNHAAREAWRQNIAQNITQAERNWQRLRATR